MAIVGCCTSIVVASSDAAVLGDRDSGWRRQSRSCRGRRTKDLAPIHEFVLADGSVLAISRGKRRRNHSSGMGDGGKGGQTQGNKYNEGEIHDDDEKQEFSS